MIVGDRRCQRCGRDLDPGQRRDARFCGAPCRAAAYRRRSEAAEGEGAGPGTAAPEEAYKGVRNGSQRTLSDADLSAITEIVRREAATAVKEVVDVLDLEPREDNVNDDRLIDALEVAARLGVTREWVYAHSAELGAVRLGAG